MTQAILAHLFSYNMTWGATRKEVEISNFFKEVPKIMKRYVTSLAFRTLYPDMRINVNQILVLHARLRCDYRWYDCLCNTLRTTRLAG
jgi:hypothetical protein